MKLLFLTNHQLINEIKQDALQHNLLPNQTENQTPHLELNNQRFHSTAVSRSEKSVLNVKQLQQKLSNDNQNQILEQQNLTVEDVMQEQNKELEQLVESLLEDYGEDYN